MDVMLNGITLQYAGQVLLPDEGTKSSIIDHRNAYICCLEDFTFGMLCGRQIIVSGEMPPRGGRAPGSQLAARFRGNVGFTGPVKAGRPEALLSDVPIRALAKKRLGAFNQVVESFPLVLRDWIVPEAEAGFGAHISLCDDELPADMYVFAKEPHPYMIDRELQDAIPKRAIRRLSKFVETALRRNNPSFDVAWAAVDEFVSRNILTHLIIDLWYDCVFRTMQPRSTRFLPYVTRRLSSRAAKRPLAQILMPHVLQDVLRESTQHDPSSFADVVLQKRDSTEYKKLRTLFAELSDLEPERHKQSEDRLREAINEMTARARLPPRPLECEPDGWRIDLAEFEPYREALEVVSKPLTTFETELGRVFPLLSPALKEIATSAADRYDRVIVQVQPMINIKNKGVVGAIGYNVQAHNFVQNQGSPPTDMDFAALARELVELQKAISARGLATDEHIAALDAIGDAKKAAAASDGNAVLLALSKAGRWALDVASSIGANVATTALKSALGL
ncbi:MAG: hypothetical protein ACOYOH_24160 [Paracraurococcus sp.]